MIKYNEIYLKSDFNLPYKFIGSTLRGAFGNALKRVVCINPKGECKECFAKDSCLYFDFFEKDFAKYRLKIKLNTKLDFSIFIFEEYIQKTPYVISAIYKAFKEIGVTKNRIKINDFKIYLNDKLAYDNEFCNIDMTPNIFNLTAEKDIYDIKLEFITPLRIKENNRFIKSTPKLETILRSINHRYLKLKNKEITKLDFVPEYEIFDSNVSFVDFTRYSNRQKTKMFFGGIVGSMDLRVDKRSYELLKLGEIIGVGKQVTFGLGGIKIWENI